MPSLPATHIIHADLHLLGKYILSLSTDSGLLVPNATPVGARRTSHTGGVRNNGHLSMMDLDTEEKWCCNNSCLGAECPHQFLISHCLWASSAFTTFAFAHTCQWPTLREMHLVHSRVSSPRTHTTLEMENRGSGTNELLTRLEKTYVWHPNSASPQR